MANPKVNQEMTSRFRVFGFRKNIHARAGDSSGSAFGFTRLEAKKE
jgi:hypothetical protein